MRQEPSAALPLRFGRPLRSTQAVSIATTILLLPRSVVQVRSGPGLPTDNDRDGVIAELLGLVAVAVMDDLDIIDCDHPLADHLI